MKRGRRIRNSGQHVTCSVEYTNSIIIMIYLTTFSYLLLIVVIRNKMLFIVKKLN